ncbi:Adenine nucleotide alpha hydrolases-like protein [Dioscorea alata]|uniref:Adenine nucleotide alpha hydrolases-like protein n=1 Tax=Dioscorea alata TaxID=55571 RepID=A0ACB7URF8_DIOAL|nr:Adenine nucleotide alpha hydrolases-like protein [Dioscorea alata]
MAFAHCSSRLLLSSTPPRPLLHRHRPISPLGFNNISFSLRSLRNRDSVLSSAFRRTLHRATAEVHESGGNAAVDVLTNVKHLLLPITDRNPYLSEGTRQAAANTASLAKKYGADITVVVIDDNPKESNPEHDTLLSNIRWHLSEGGFQEFGLMERLGEGKKPTAIIGEVADDLNLDLVVLSMEAIHSKHVDANLLAEFVPCPVLLLPL